jgi:hypothetical protein
MEYASENLCILKGLARAACLSQCSVHGFASVTKESPNTLITWYKFWKRNKKEPPKDVGILVTHYGLIAGKRAG